MKVPGDGWWSRQSAARTLADQELTEAMRVLRETTDERGRPPRERFYGRRKMRALLRRKGYRDSEARVGRLMRLAGMKGLVRGGRITTTKKSAPTAGDLLKRVFAADAPDRVWATDLTYVRTRSGWVYVGFITDAFSRRIVACHAGTT